MQTNHPTADAAAVAPAAIKLRGSCDRYGCARGLGFRRRMRRRRSNWDGGWRSSAFCRARPCESSHAGLMARDPIAVRIGTGTFGLRLFEAACIRVCPEQPLLG